MCPPASTHKSRDKVKRKRKPGIYTRLKEENSPAKVTQFMSELKTIQTCRTMRPDTIRMNEHYKKIIPAAIASILPLYYLAQKEYTRIYQEEASLLFLRLRKVWFPSGIYLEIFSFLALYFLMLNEGKDFLNNLSEWVELQEVTYETVYHEFPEEFQRLFSEKLNVSFSEKKEIVRLYNSCFTHNVIEYDEKNDDFLPIIK